MKQYQALTTIQYYCLALYLIFSINISYAEQAAAPNARDLVQAAMNHWRGLSSYSEMTMIIHRRDWERTMTMQVWTKGEKTSLVRVTQPKKDAGNGTLLIDNNMWNYTPKVNRIIKIPSSMMNQSWMGSDFSNKDISKSTDLIDQYEHKLISTQHIKDHVLYTIESVPHEEAAVVWGKEILIVRDDFVLIRHEFWDQDNALIREMNTQEIAIMDGRAMATRSRINKSSQPDEWTEMSINQIDFDADLPKSLFTLSNLRNPRQ